MGKWAKVCQICDIPMNTWFNINQVNYIKIEKPYCDNLIKSSQCIEHCCYAVCQNGIQKNRVVIFQNETIVHSGKEDFEELNRIYCGHI